jgi:F-type H+-transporting ATPase subunit delta
MANEILIKRYADALVSLSAATGSEVAFKDGQTLLDVLAKTPAFAAFLANRSLSSTVRLSALRALAPYLQLSDLMERFLRVLAANNRLSMLESVLRAALAQQRERQHGKSATVIVPAALNDAARADMDAAAQRVLGRKVSLIYKVDATLLGGYQILDGSTLYDYSKNGTLERLRRHLAA